MTLGGSRSSGDVSAIPGRRIASCRSRPSLTAVPRVAPTMATRPSFPAGTAIGHPPNLMHANQHAMPMVGMHTQATTYMFPPFDSHNNGTEMARHAGPPVLDLQIPSWAGLLPDMGPDPPAEMFGIQPLMTPTNVRHSYFGHEVLDMAEELSTGLPPSLATPVQYQEFSPGGHHALPFRGGPPGMPPDEDVNMGMMSSHFYGSGPQGYC
jgi:hypothetical protein